MIVLNPDVIRLVRGTKSQRLLQKAPNLTRIAGICAGRDSSITTPGAVLGVESCTKTDGYCPGSKKAWTLRSPEMDARYPREGA
jgi:hypothetical protein